jgi:soluble lytic murein transglycosylase
VLGLSSVLLMAGHAQAPRPSNSGALQSVREEFTAAMQRVRQNLGDLPDSPGLRTYAIYDYLVAARLRRDVAQKPDDALDSNIAAFLAAHEGKPVARALRRDWMINLGQRRRWDLFLARSVDANDPVLVCDRLTGRLATGDLDGLAAAALVRWLQPQRPPPECAEPNDWLKQQNLLTPALAEQRARAALAADNPRFAREAAADVPLARQVALLQWAYLLEAPKPALTILATHPTLPAEPDALAAGFDKLTHSDAGSALSLLPALLSRPDSTPILQSHLRRAAALGIAYDRDPRALAAFAQIPADASDAQVEEWRVRAALWSAKYTEALDSIEHMPTSLATQPRWRYWRARMVEATAGADAATGLYAELAGLRDYYGYLAADRVHAAYQLHARASADAADVQAAIAAQPGMIRAHELFLCDATDDAMSEWAAAMGGADPATKIQAAHLASRWGWYSQSIVALAQAGDWDDLRLRYPRPYADAVGEASKLTGVPSDWILSVMRQESLFRKDAVSRADARGLMQMMPATAVQVARRWHLPAPGKEGLFDPAIAIPLGAANLRELLDRHADQMAVTLAAYNAGPNAAARWLPDKPMPADVWIENIPFNETRTYVQHVLEHMVAFAFVRDGELPHLDTLLPAVGPGM